MDLSDAFRVSSPSADQNVALDPRGLASLKSAAQQQAPEAMAKAAQQFEAVFLGMMLKSMREAGQGFQSEPASPGMSSFTGMFDQKIAEVMAQRGGLGLADLMIRQMSLSQQLAAENSAHVSAQAADKPV